MPTTMIDKNISLATLTASPNRIMPARNHGMAIQARDGADQKKLSSIAESAIAAWDGLTASS